MRNPHKRHLLDPTNAATSYLMRHAMHLNRVDALESCIVHLMSQNDLSERNAELHAIQAYAELNCLNQTAIIDADATTAHVVVLRTEGGRPVMFTADDLMKVLQSAREEGRARVVNSDTRRPVVIQ
ncbi:hypothetical protein SAMN02745148_01554 [Modicisalibacter ilicicola DSM 19980]|uniref:Uncharacterized protein n=1 Tax=Modicisalibacter ilicicola DSM 19980 TaxID=1121942 RepID=A0A1M4Y236_9GAMM|nr:hypothetical protein [Halomonas ilicicola]SHE99749.1 hypothetical protein SAMN02745148_01554 [Halomonas ilicicola DSM 19980]